MAILAYLFLYLLGLPQCGDKIEPELMLYLNDANKTECTLSLKNLPNNATNHCFNLIKNHGEITKLVLATHGFLNNLQTIWLHTLKDAILETEPHSAVLVSDIKALTLLDLETDFKPVSS